MTVTRLKLDTDVVKTSVVVTVEAAIVAGERAEMPRVLVHAEDLIAANADGAECLCLTPAQAERLGTALLRAAKESRRLR